MAYVENSLAILFSCIRVITQKCRYELLFDGADQNPAVGITTFRPGQRMALCLAKCNWHNMHCWKCYPTPLARVGSNPLHIMQVIIVLTNQIPVEDAQINSNNY